MKQLSQSALEVLESGLRIAGAHVVIEARLDRSLYAEVNSALEAIGGKWARKEKSHVFESDPADAIDRVVTAGGFVDAKRDLQQFFTPVSLAAQLADRADVDGKIVLEPSAGSGSLASACRLAGAMDVQCVEIDPKLVVALRLRGFANVIEGDFLRMKPGLEADAGGIGLQPSRIVMNPPFTRQQDIDHVLHAFRFLGAGGKLVSVMSAGVKFRSTQKAKDFRAMIAKCGTIEDLPESSFRESGTDVRAVVVTMEKKP